MKKPENLATYPVPAKTDQNFKEEVFRRNVAENKTSNFGMDLL